MKFLFLNAPYKEKVQLSKETLITLQKKNYSKLALFSSVQFLDSLPGIARQLKKINVKTQLSLAARAQEKGQLLGCDCSYAALNLKEEVDAFLYIGDGRFHPLALVYAQKDLKVIKEVLCYDPLQKKITMLGLEQIRGVLQRYRGGLLKFLSAKNVGVIISLKPGQEQMKAALLLEKKYAKKKFYYFVDDKISFDQLENFPFIDVWVNSACPRIGLDENEQFRKGVINLGDALQAEKILG